MLQATAPCGRRTIWPLTNKSIRTLPLGPRLLANARQSKKVPPAQGTGQAYDQEVRGPTGGNLKGNAADWDVKLLYDGDCPVCLAEVKLLQSRDNGRGRIEFVDINADDYDPQDNADITFEEAMGSIHAILSDGKVVTGVDAFRQLYSAVGLGWVFAVTSFEPVGRLARCAYGMWAKNRLALTGRHDLETILGEKKGCKETECDAHWDL